MRGVITRVESSPLEFALTHPLSAVVCSSKSRFSRSAAVSRAAGKTTRVSVQSDCVYFT